MGLRPLARLAHAWSSVVNYDPVGITFSLTFRRLIRVVSESTGRECSLRCKRFQSSYSAKVGEGEGEGKGRRGNACPQTPRFW